VPVRSFERKEKEEGKDGESRRIRRSGGDGKEEW
jgi:hypothetical protein